MLILAGALLLRVYLASVTALIWDEHDEWILVAERISFAPGALHLPIREGHHPALASYFIKLGSMLFGPTELGYRAASIVAGTLTIVVAYRMALLWFGRQAARWTAVLMAFIEYHIGVSVLAVQLGPYQFFASCAIFAFVESLRSSRPRLLVLAAAMTGLAFLCTEIGTLLMPIFFIALLALGRASWLRRWEPYLAALVFFLVISPDMVANLQAQNTSDLTRDYGDHLERFGGVGFNPQPLLFWFRDAAEGWHAAMGREYEVPGREYPGMNLLFGLVLASAAVVATLRWRKLGSESGVLLLVIWGVLGFFMAIRPGTARNMDRTAWFWADLILVPSVLVAGSFLAGLTGWRRTVLWTTVGLGVVISVVSVLGFQLDLNRKEPSATGKSLPACFSGLGTALPVDAQQEYTEEQRPVGEPCPEDIRAWQAGERDFPVSVDRYGHQAVATPDRRQRFGRSRASQRRTFHHRRSSW